MPTPLGHQANTPEIVRAFEAAVSDGMNVINFSGGGPETDPANDAMNEAVRNTALAGVVPVIAAGNDREDFGLGSAGSPGTAPDAISVAATSNSHVFAPALTYGRPAVTRRRADPGRGRRQAARRLVDADQPLVDISSVLGSDGKPVETHLCGPATDPNGSLGTIVKARSPGSRARLARHLHVRLEGRARGARRRDGLVVIDNRFGEANPIPIPLPIPAGMISDLDGAHLRAYLARTAARRRSGSRPTSASSRRIAAASITSFSSAGPTDFGHFLKPDVSAPGLDVLSSTPPLTTGSTFSVFAGTSMATPHVAGAAALLLQQHPGWSSWQVKSALMSTAGPAWGDTARTQEAPVLLEGAGLANVAAAERPEDLHRPAVALVPAHRRLDRRAAESMLLTLADAGNGSGTWTVSLAPQAQTRRRHDRRARPVDVAPGGDVAVPVVVRAAANATTGENSGFIVLSGNGVQRRVPYAFLVERPALANAPVTKLKKLQLGDTRTGTNRVSDVLLPVGAVRAAADLHRRADERGRLRAPLLHRHQPAGRQLRRLGARVDAGLADRPVRARLEGRERRPGLRGHADRRQRAHLRRERRHRRGGRAVPAAAALLRLGRLARRRVHGQAAEGQVHPERVGRTT